MESSEAKVTAICGFGAGKTDAAIGKGVRALAEGKTVTCIRFLKGRTNESFMRVLKKLEPEMKAFSFEKYEGMFADLSEGQKAEARTDIQNGIGFAKKVMATGGCDLLILDEVLGLTDLGLLPVSELKQILEGRPEDMTVVITGQMFPDELKECVDSVSHIENGFPV